MTAATLDLTLVQGDSLSLPFIATDSASEPIDFTDVVIRSHIKRNPANVAPDEEFTVTMTDAEEGQFALSLTPEQSTELKVTKQDGSNVYYYDIELAFSEDNVQTWVSGTLTIAKQVTR